NARPSRGLLPFSWDARRVPRGSVRSRAIVPQNLSATSTEMNVTAERSSERACEPAWQAYRLLHWGFVAAPVIAGLDKFFNLLVHWDKYLAPSILNLSPLGAAGSMNVVGVVEIVAGLVVALRPRIGAWVVAAWLA